LEGGGEVPLYGGALIVGLLENVVGKFLAKILVGEKLTGEFEFCDLVGVRLCGNGLIEGGSGLLVRHLRLSLSAQAIPSPHVHHSYIVSERSQV
jgi:hypothetical protein